MEFRIEVFWLTDLPDGRATDLLARLERLDIHGVDQVSISDLYFLRGDLSPGDAERVAIELLVDPVVEGYHVQPIDAARGASGPGLVVEVGYHPGVTDPVAANLLRRAHLLGIGGVEAADTGTHYVLGGSLSENDLHTIARELLCNEVIQSYSLGPMRPAFVPQAKPSAEVESIPLRNLDDKELARLSVERVLFLSLAEMQAVRDEFVRLGRDPTDAELETLAQTWSEHCQHKAFKAQIEYTCLGGMPRLLPGGLGPVPPYDETVRGLLPSYIRAATQALARPWVRSAFVDNAGVVDFDDQFEVSFKVETHNHPSALEPFGGANTGVGGVIRDVIGVSHRPIANTDVLCFAPGDLPPDQRPHGTLHPRRIAEGVVAGIEDYGNKMGIPTVSGAILYDSGYAANPLIFCGCVGMAPKESHRRDPQPGDLAVVLGGQTGRDGLHGATFSSAELTHETGETVGSVVQIGDPIVEKAVLEAVMIARDEGLYTAITDCGAGGLSSAIGEMGSRVGVEVELEEVRLKYPGLRPWEIWLSEAQERMVLAVLPDNLPDLQAICDSLDVEWTVVGRFTGDGRLRVHYGGQLVADLDMGFLHNGWSTGTMRAVWTPPESPEPELEALADWTATLLQMLAYPDVASKEAVIRRYDHEVQGATVVKPLVGVASDGPSDAPVLKPMETEGWQGLALGCGVNPHYGRLDPYAMAWAAVDEALRNVVCVGADPDRVALLDNFCWGSPRLPDRLGGLVRAAQGCHDAAIAYGAPFVSGKDSLNNEYVDPQGIKRAVPPTLLVSSLGIVPDVRRSVTMDLKAAGHLLYIVGETDAELGGSLYHRLHDSFGRGVPTPRPGSIGAMRALHRAMCAGLVLACHDCSEGGLAVAAAEMALAGRLGLELNLASLLRPTSIDRDDLLLFSESSGRFLVEVAPDNSVSFEAELAGHPFACLGRTLAPGDQGGRGGSPQKGAAPDASPVPATDHGLEASFLVRGLRGDLTIDCSVGDLLRAWKPPEVQG